MDSIQVIPASPIVKRDSLIVLGSELLFEINKSTLRSDHFAVLDPIVDYLILNPKRSIRISGHTDDTGSVSHNLNLSKKRADVVAEYMILSGIEIRRVETIGVGSAKPIDFGNTDEARQKNRRVELLIYDVP
jgi:outer membrane protein OmpA-like peptidoglycan-associated protein